MHKLSLPKRRLFWLNLAIVLAMVISILPFNVDLPGRLPDLGPEIASAHNLNASVVYAFFDPSTQKLLDDRIAGGWVPGTPLIQSSDELGIILKVVPDSGTTTGVGGYTTFYVPNGIQVVDAGFVMPGDFVSDGILGWDKVPAKGQAQMPIVGAGGGPTVSLVGITRGPNILGVSSPIVTSGNVNLGTLPGVYGDTGIFYSTVPETAFGTYSGGALQNNSGDNPVGLRTVLNSPLNLWDAWQMAAYGIAGSANPNYPTAALVDSNQRGYAPWGLANVVAGPQSGYAWEFDFAKYATCDPTPTATPLANCIDLATQDVGPWQRIKYPGSQFSDDPPGGTASLPQPYTRGADASNSGFALSPANPLPLTTGQSNGTPNAVRWAFGQLTYLSPEYAWVKVKVANPAGIVDPSGCPMMYVDTFGGDAGGDSGGKDHIWRYYDPNSVTFNGCLAVGKPANREFVKSGDTYQYSIKVYNLANITYSNVTVKDTLPSGVTFLSAVPAQNSGPNPLQWNNIGALVGDMDGLFEPGEKFEATVTVKASSAGVICNTVTVTGQPPSGPVSQATSGECTPSSTVPLLRQLKSVTPTSISPGGQVEYTIDVKNVGSGPSGSPVTITEFMPSGFTYVGPLVSATLNGANVTGTTTVNASNPAQPVITVSGAINPGKELVIKFKAQVAANATPGSYCNSYRLTQNNINTITGSLACVNVGGAAIGDTIWRDWDGDGVQDAGEDGIPGVTVNVYAGVCPPSGGVLDSDVTDASGNYLINGLTAGTYCVAAPNPGAGGVPAGYTLTGDPNGAPISNTFQITLADSEERNDIDFGYRPGGSGSIGDLVWNDINGDGSFNGTDSGIANITVNLYEDSNGNGAIDSGDLLIATANTNGSGIYGFASLATGLNYIVDVDENDPDLVSYFNPNSFTATTPNVQPVANLAGAYTAADFGYKANLPGSIGDTVCIDSNENSLCDSGEPGIANITVSLYRDADNDGVADPGELAATTSTDILGNYLFSALGPDDYIVVVDTADPDLPGGYAPEVERVALTLSVGQNVTTADFPFTPLLTKTVDKASANAGDTLTYTLTPNYTGSSLLTNAVVMDTVPTGTTYAGNDSPPAASEPALGGTGTVQWNLGSNASGTAGTASGSVGGGTVNAPTNADSWLDSANATTNHGAATTMRLDSGGGANGNGRPVFRFDLSGIPAGATITGATLKLTLVAASDTSSRTLRLYPLTKAFVENQVTWNIASTGNNWTSAGGDFGAELDNTVVSVLGQYSWSSAALTTQVQNWFASPATNFGLLIGDTATGVVTKDFATKEHATSSSHPVLEITYTGGVSSPGTTTTLATNRTLVKHGDVFDVTMTLATTSSGAVSNVTASGSLTVNGTNGFTATCGSPTLTSADDDIANTSDPVTYEYSCTANASGVTAVPASATFTGGATATGATFNNGTSNSALAAPALNFKVQVNNPATVNPVQNTGYINDAGVIPSTPSNTVETVIGASIGDRVWADLDGDGVQDAGEPGISGVEVCATPTGGGAATCATTDALGNYRIAGLTNNASYDVSPTPATYPSGYAPSTPTTLTRVAITAGVDDADFGLRPLGTASIGDTVWVDSDEDGILDPVESGLPGITVRLYIDQDNDGVIDGGDTLLQTTSTDANGNYEFTGLHPDDYLVEVDETGVVTTEYGVNTTIAAAMDLVSGDNPRDVTISTPGEAITDADFGYNWGGSIGDYAWYDSNGDAVQDPGELPAPNASVVLYYDLNGDGQYQSGEPILGVDESDINGAYLFDNLPPGDYVVQVSEQEVPAPPTSANAGLIGLMVATTGTEASVTLAPSEARDNVDWGFIEAGEISGHVFHDDNRNTLFDPSETPLTGITVWLDLDDDGLFDPGEPSTTTDGSGEYSFIVPPGSYTIAYNTSQTTAAGYPAPTTPISIVIPVAAGQEIDSLDFGVDYTGEIGDTVFNDANANGAQDSGEPGIAAVTVWLLGDNDNSGDLSPGDTFEASTITNAQGKYLFPGLKNGNYVVFINAATLPVDFGQTADPDVAGVCGVNCDDQGAATVSGGGSDLTVDFGYVYAPIGGSSNFTIGGSVYEDTNGDGSRQPLELGFANVEVIVVCDTGAFTTFTDSNGDWFIAGIVPGSTCSVLDADENDLPRTDYTPTETPGTPIVVNSNIIDLNFGYEQQPGSISGTVCNGTGDGLCDDPGDTPMQGVTVTLNWAGPDGILGTADDTTTTDTTDANGDYSFSGLQPGLYQIIETNPLGYISVADADGGNPDNISVTLSLAGNVTNRDFEDTVITGDLGDFVFLDSDGDGVQDPGETTGITGVQVTAVNQTTNAVYTAITNGLGLYLFDDIPAGLYLVSTPANLPNLVRTTNPLTVSVPANGQNLSADFGYIAPTAITLTAFTVAESRSGVLLRWSTAQEEDLDGFVIWRASAADGEYKAVSGVLPAANDPTGSAYDWLDASAKSGVTYWYKIEVQPDGVFYGPIPSRVEPGPGGSARVFIPRILR